MAGFRSECLMNLGHYKYICYLKCNVSEAEEAGMQTLTGTPNDCRAIHSVLHALEGRVGIQKGGYFIGTQS